MVTVQVTAQDSQICTLVMASLEPIAMQSGWLHMLEANQ